MTTITIGDRKIGKGCAPFIIAEAGINHNGDIKIAKKMIEKAKAAGADAVKFQTFDADEFIQDKSTTYTYKSQGKEITEPMIDMFKRTEFTPAQWREIAEYCRKIGIIFLSTPGNVSDLNLLLEIGIPAVKIGSDDFVNIPLIEEYGSHGLPLLLSCGMANEEEVHRAIKAAGLEDNKQVVLFLCTSEYPTPVEDVNIQKLITIREKYPTIITGLSDHTQGTMAAVMAVAMGACVFEKHFTLNHDMPGPDHWFSEEPKELKTWVDSIRTAHKMLGSDKLVPTLEEEKMRKIAHRSITFSKDIKSGDLLSEENLCMRRPGTGMPGFYWKEVLGKRAKRDFKTGEQPSWEEIE